MQFTISTLLLLASSVLAAPQGKDSSFKTIDFVPGVKIPESCLTSPEGNVCPAKLASGNALVTSRNVVLDSLTGASRAFSNNFRSGWSYNSEKHRLTEESNLSIFDFPYGMEKKECRFQFVTDGGDLVPGILYHNVWALAPNSGVISLDTTYFDKPEREQVIATFVADETLAVKHKTSNNKYIHQFVYGPGEGAPLAAAPKGLTFPCPAGGIVAYEVASAIKAAARPGEIINAGGNNGLGIEIIGEKAGW